MYGPYHSGLLQPSTELRANPEQWTIKIRPFWTELWDHSYTADSLYALYRSLEAPYAFYERALYTLELGLQKRFQLFHLVVRGSVHARTALKYAVDLDVDLIIPRAMAITEESGGEMPQTKPLASNPDEFTAFVRSVALVLFAAKSVPSVAPSPSPAAASSSSAQAWTSGVRSSSSRAHGEWQLPGSEDAALQDLILNLSRSVPFTLWVDGVPVEVDLFPKLLDSQGNVCEVGKKQSGKGREWTKTPFRQACPSSAFEFTDIQRAAILILKMWRYENKRSTTVKSFQINMAMEKVATEPDHEAAQSSAAAASSAPKRKKDEDGKQQGMSSTQSTKEFSVNAVYNAMAKATKILVDEGHSDNSLMTLSRSVSPFLNL